jgi:hypothetical protein
MAPAMMFVCCLSKLMNFLDEMGRSRLESFSRTIVPTISQAQAATHVWLVLPRVRLKEVRCCFFGRTII